MCAVNVNIYLNTGVAAVLTAASVAPPRDNLFRRFQLGSKLIYILALIHVSSRTRARTTLSLLEGDLDQTKNTTIYIDASAHDDDYGRLVRKRRLITALNPFPC